MKLLSFIIPLYNCEQYIARCLDSVFSCALPEDEYEVIVVDDGSNDNGAAVVKEYAAAHGNLCLHQQENRGASAARNKGIDLVQGEYIWFVDADDRIDPSPLGIILQEHKNGQKADIYCFNHTSENADGDVYTEEFKERLTLSGCDYILRAPYFYLWNKVFRRESIGSVRFPDGTRNTEDWYFDIATIIDMQRVACLPVNGYYYNTTNMQSTLRTRSEESIRRNRHDTMQMHDKVLQLISSTTDGRKRLAMKQALNYSVTGFLYAQFADRVKVKDIRDVLRQYRSKGMYPVEKTHSKRANRFLLVANRPWMFYPLAWLHWRKFF